MYFRQRVALILFFLGQWKRKRGTCLSLSAKNSSVRGVSKVVASLFPSECGSHPVLLPPKSVRRLLSITIHLSSIKHDLRSSKNSIIMDLRDLLAYNDWHVCVRRPTARVYGQLLFANHSCPCKFPSLNVNTTCVQCFLLLTQGNQIICMSVAVPSEANYIGEGERLHEII